MSAESAREFVERIKTDEEFNNKVKECKNAEERLMFVKNAGFDFTAEEIKAVGEQQLCDGDLDEVVGGREDAENGFCLLLYY